MDKLTIGEKVYIDTFAGMIKGIVTDIKIKYPGLIDMSGQTSCFDLTIKVTAKNNRVYNYGEILHSSGLHVIPRLRYHKTGIQRYTVYPDYTWSK